MKNFDTLELAKQIVQDAKSVDLQDEYYANALTAMIEMHLNQAFERGQWNQLSLDAKVMLKGLGV